MWVLYAIAIFGVFGLVVGTALVAYHLGNWMYALVIMPFWIIGLVGISIDFTNDIKLHGLEVGDDALKGSASSGSQHRIWQDVTRYEPSRRSGFTLFFKDGGKLKVPFYVSDFEFFRHFCLAKLEEIGTFEDGRKVPRAIWGFKFR